MPADNVPFDISSLETCLKVMVDRASNLRGVLPAIGDILVTAIDDEIQTEGRGRWKALAEATLERRRKNGRGAKMLQDTGLLAQIQVMIESDAVEATSPADYDIFHTSDAPRKIIPMRDFYDVMTDDVSNEIGDLVLNEVVGGD